MTRPPQLLPFPDPWLSPRTLPFGFGAAGVRSPPGTPSAALRHPVPALDQQAAFEAGSGADEGD
ncbi:hypothetical protein GCM10017776_59920 [Streptomyces griseoluteus]|nr:hypothetical protein GCM10017776_59920 [Streptomyces griseoluteus]